MSIASEYAKRVHAAKQEPEIFKVDTGDHKFIARVTPYGELYCSTYSISPEDALKLAQWIIDTFGEKEAVE